MARDRKERDQAADEERKKAQMTEAEKAKAEKAEAEKKAAETLATANERLIRAEVKLISVELGIVDADVAYAVMDRQGVKVDDKTGKVEGVKPALEELLKAKPFLKAAAGLGKPGVGAPGGNPGPTGAPDAVEAAKKFAEERNKSRTAPAGGYDPWAVK